MNESTCPKCSGKMSEGFVLDQMYGANTQATWVDGEPVRSFWSGVKLTGKELIPVRTLRCENCGFLESYATHTEK